MGKFTKEEAIRLHRVMWSAMKENLGDNPNAKSRCDFKYNWLNTHGYVDEYGDVDIDCYCFLCEYANDKHIEDLKKGVHRKRCAHCPIDWSELTPDRNSFNYGYCIYVSDDGYEVWETEPISKILELPERENVE